MSSYLELAKQTVAAASGDGVEVEVYISEQKDTEIRVSRGEVEQLSQSGQKGMGVRVIDGGRTGYAYTSDFSESGIRETWQFARELAKVATPDAFRSLPDPRPISEEDLEIWDESMLHLSTADKIAFLKRVEKSAFDYDKRIVMSQWCTFQDTIARVSLANSRGFAGDYGQTTAASYMIAIARSESGDATNSFGLGVSTFFSDLDAKKIGEEAAQKAISMLDGKPVETQVGTVVLDHVVGAQILGVIAQSLSAEAWQKKRSFLMDRLGDTVGRDNVTLMDNGRLKRGLASAPFDGEGVPTGATRLIDEGVLQNIIYDSYSAKKANVQSTGNAQRFQGHRRAATLGPSNFYMQPGTKSAEEIIAGVERGLYVLNVMQTGGIDPITGDCSMGANGLWIENGRIVGPVAKVTIATTLNELLNNVVEVGSDLRMVPFFGNIGVPTLRIDNVTIGGAS